MGYFNEVVENFSKLSDIISDHVAMCTKVQEELNSREDETEEEDEDSVPQRRRSDITR
jgi:hypothetical protein